MSTTLGSRGPARVVEQQLRVGPVARHHRDGLAVRRPAPPPRALRQGAGVMAWTPLPSARAVTRSNPSAVLAQVDEPGPIRRVRRVLAAVAGADQRPDRRAEWNPGRRSRRGRSKTMAPLRARPKGAGTRRCEPAYSPAATMAAMSSTRCEQDDPPGRRRGREGPQGDIHVDPPFGEDPRRALPRARGSRQEGSGVVGVGARAEVREDLGQGALELAIAVHVRVPFGDRDRERSKVGGDLGAHLAQGAIQPGLHAADGHADGLGGLGQ